jgi:hypothetical protein
MRSVPMSGILLALAMGGVLWAVIISGLIAVVAR